MHQINPTAFFIVSSPVTLTTARRLETRSRKKKKNQIKTEFTHRSVAEQKFYLVFPSVFLHLYHIVYTSDFINTARIGGSADVPLRVFRRARLLIFYTRCRRLCGPRVRCIGLLKYRVKQNHSVNKNLMKTTFKCNLYSLFRVN